VCRERLIRGGGQTRSKAKSELWYVPGVIGAKRDRINGGVKSGFEKGKSKGLEGAKDQNPQTRKLKRSQKKGDACERKERPQKRGSETTVRLTCAGMWRGASNKE